MFSGVLLVATIATWKRKDSDCNARTYKDDVNGLRLTLHRGLLIDRAMSTGQRLKSFID